jgi:hypothetical protein
MHLAQPPVAPVSEPKPVSPIIRRIAEFLASHPHRITGTALFLGIKQPPSRCPALKAEQMYKG